MKTETKRIMTFLVVGIVVLALTGCILEPGETKGSVTLSVSLNGSSVGASGALGVVGVADIRVDTARVWMYRNGAEYTLGDLGYVEVTGTGGTVTIEEIPAGEDYSIVAVLGKKDSVSGVFQPISYAQAGPFDVVGERETVVSPTSRSLLDLSAIQSINYPSSLQGKSLNSVVRVDDGTNNAVIVADRSAVYTSSNGGQTFSTGEGELGNTIFSVTLGKDIAEISNGNTVESAYVNTDEGVFPLFYNGASWELTSDSTDFAESMRDDNNDPITNTTFSGVFSVYGEAGIVEAMVVFYQRWGGLGAGLIDPDYSWDDGSNGVEWIDIGNTDDMDFQPFSDTESPVRAMATSGTASGYFATSIGTFRLTEDLFEGDEELSPNELVGNDVDGLTFFGVPFPGTNRPVRINAMALFMKGEVESVMVGTPRGAFWFSDSAIDDLTDSNSVRSVSAIREVRGQKVVGLTRSGDYLAILTEEKVLVLDTDTLNAVMNVPTRALVLGAAEELFFDVDNAGIPRLYIAGSEGLSVVTMTGGD